MSAVPPILSKRECCRPAAYSPSGTGEQKRDEERGDVRSDRVAPRILPRHRPVVDERVAEVRPTAA
jgi:hypothetical protein